MRCINHIGFFSIYDNVCAQKSLKHTCPGFDSVVPLHSVRDKIMPVILHLLLVHDESKFASIYIV